MNQSSRGVVKRVFHNIKNTKKGGFFNSLCHTSDNQSCSKTIKVPTFSSPMKNSQFIDLHENISKSTIELSLKSKYN